MLLAEEPDEYDGILSTLGVDTPEWADKIMRPFDASVRSAIRTAGDLPLISNISDFAKDVGVYHSDPLVSAIQALGKTAISSVTPNVVAAAAKGADDKQRSTYSGDGTLDVLRDVLFSRIPGLRETLPTVTDVTGAEKSNPGTLAERLVNAMLNPIGVNEYTQSDVSKELQDVREATGRSDFYPTKSIPSELKYTKDGQTHEMSLSFEQRQDFQALRSASQFAAVSEMMGSDYYKNASAEGQADLLKFCSDYAYQRAKVETLGGTGDSAYLKTERMMGAGLSLSQWAEMKNSVDADGSGSVTKEEVTCYIEAHFPRGQWSKVFEAYKGNSSWKNPYAA